MAASRTTPPTSSAAMRLLRSIVGGGSEAPSLQKPSNVLRFLQSQRAQEGTAPGTASDMAPHRDPVREAAMNHVRRLRIHAA